MRLGEFALMHESKSITLGNSPRRIEESVFGKEAQAKTREVQKKKGSPFLKQALFMTLDRGVQFQQGVKPRGGGPSRRVHSRHDTAILHAHCNECFRDSPYIPLFIVPFHIHVSTELPMVWPSITVADMQAYKFTYMVTKICLLWIRPCARRMVISATTNLPTSPLIA